MSSLTHEINVTYYDADGDTSTATYELPNTVAVTDVGLFASALVGLIVPLINGGIRSISYTIQVTVPALTADGISDVQELLAIGARSATGFLKRMRIPTIDEVKAFIPGSKSADLEDADVLALRTAIISGIDLTGAGGSGVVQLSDNHGADISTVEYMTEEFGGS